MTEANAPSADNSPLRQSLLIAAVAIAYFLAAQAGLAFASAHGGASLVWPAAGVALAAVLLGGPLLAAGVLLGGLAVYLAMGSTLGSALAVAGGGAIGALAGRVLLRAAGDTSARLDRVRDVGWLALGGACGSALVTATIGTAARVGAGAPGAEEVLETWITWWRGDALGILLITPLLLTWITRPRPTSGTVVALATAAGIGGAFLASVRIFGGAEGGAAMPNFVAFGFFALALWPATRLAIREVATFNVVFAAIAISGTAAGSGPFAAEHGADALTVLHVFLTFLSITTLFVCASAQERRAALRELVQSETRFRSLAELSTDWYWEQDVQYRFTALSGGFRTATGLDPALFIGRPRWHFLKLGEQDADWIEHRRVLDARAPFRDLRLSWDTATGERRHFLTSGEPVYAPDGTFAGYRGVGRDVTAQQRAEDALRESEERYATIFQSSTAAIFTVRVGDDDAFRFEGLNSAAEALLGVSAGAVIGRTPTQTLPPKTARGGDRRLRECAAQGAPITYDEVLVGPNGSRNAVFTLVPIRDAAGRTHRIVGIGIDTTEQRRTEARLRESMELFARIFAISAHPMVITRLAESTVTEVNPAWCKLFKLSRDDVVGKRLEELDLLADPSDRPRIFAALRADRSIRGMPLRFRLRDGSQVEALYSGDLIDIHGETSVLTSLVDVTESRRAEQAIRASREHFEKVFRASPQPLAISGIDDGRVFEVNDTWVKTYGYAREEVVGRDFLQLGLWVEPDGRRPVRESLRRDGAVRNIECRWRRKSGEIAEVLLSGEVIKLGDEDVMLSTGMDITERKRAERLLRESESRFAKIFQSSPLPVVISRLSDGQYLDVNEAWGRFFGYSRADALERTSLDLGIWTSPADRDAFVRALTSGETLRNREVRYRKRSGEVADMLLSAEPIELLGERCAVSLLMDITERKRAEQQLRESERRFRDFAEAAGEYVWEVDRDTRYTFVSRRVEAVLGYRPEDLYGRRPFDLMPPGEADRVRELLEHTLTGGQPLRNVEHRSLTRSGTLVWQLVSAVPIHADDGRITGLRGTALDISERKRAEARIEELATRDPLTSLPNRLLLSDRLTQGIASAARGGAQLAVMFIDLDHFKAINDTLGHHVGDLLLKEVAKRLGAVVRKDDTLARLGGDEFVVVLEGLRSPDDAGQVAQKILNSLSHPYQIEGHDLRTAASVGIALYPSDGSDAATLMRHADTAMYAAKSGGRKNFQFFSTEMNTRAVERGRLEAALRRATADGELRLFYQPRVDIASGRVTGAEALLRWRHPEQGLIGPDRFIRVAEETGLVVPIGDWVVDTAAVQAKAWASAGWHVPVAVNVSGRQFAPGLPESVAATLTATGLDPSMFEVELTEATLMRDPEMARAVLARLAGLGVRIVVDDFGTGYASMHSLKRFAVQAVKVHRSLIAAMDTSPEERTVVRAIFDMARSLGVDAIAVGVESEAQLEMLAEMGCREYLGHHFLAPVPAAELERRLTPGSKLATMASRRTPG
ncbi:MAG: PAS domain S-box protein [Burkholderiales bacterium]|nr:PAS domain S-box protein [Burkholderiales bacterium]